MVESLAAGPLRPLADLAQGLNTSAVPIQRVQEILAQWLTPVETVEQLSLRACRGRILATDIRSPIDVPQHDNSAMDGWAIRSADLAPDGTTRLRAVDGAAWAGRPWSGTLAKGQCLRIFTGAVMPAGADTVIAQEFSHLEPQLADSNEAPTDILFDPGQEAGQNRRLAGEDLRRGEVALVAGTRLGPAHLGLAASLGLAELPIRRRLRVALLSTGDELRSIGEALGPGEIYDSNRFTLSAMLEQLGLDLIDLGVVRDDPIALETQLRRGAAAADVIVSSGGVSVGEADFTRSVLARIGEVAFWTVAMRPGRPFALGRVGPAVYFGLPGNPVAVMVTFLFLVRDALERMSGALLTPRFPLKVRSAHPLRKRKGRTEYQRAIVRQGVDGDLEAHPTGQQGSGVLSSMARANAMIVLQHDQGDVREGEFVDAFLFDGLL